MIFLFLKIKAADLKTRPESKVFVMPIWANKTSINYQEWYMLQGGKHIGKYCLKSLFPST